MKTKEINQHCKECCFLSEIQRLKEKVEYYQGINSNLMQVITNLTKPESHNPGLKVIFRYNINQKESLEFKRFLVTELEENT